MITDEAVRALWVGFETHMGVERGPRDTYSLSCLDYTLYVIDRGSGLVLFVPADESDATLQGSMTESGLVDINLENPGAAVFIFEQREGYRLAIIVHPESPLTRVGPMKGNIAQLRFPIGKEHLPNIEIVRLPE